MFDSDSQGELVTVDLGDDIIAQVEVIDTGREQVGAGTLPFNSIAKAINRLSQIIAKPIQEVKPTKAIVKYGLAIGIEEGSLVAAVVRGTGKANLEITLEWENKPDTNQKKS